MKELNKELDITAEAVDTMVEEINNREELLCKGHVCAFEAVII